MITEAMIEANARVMFDCYMNALGYGGQLYWTDTFPEPYQKKIWIRNSRAALEAADRAAWQPIETAPRDGMVIDVWLGDAEQADIDFYCAAGSRRSTDWRWQSGKFRPVMGLSIAATLVQPTHWRPRPEPPRPEGGR